MYFCPHLNKQTAKCDLSNMCSYIRRCNQQNIWYNPDYAKDCKLLKEKIMNTNFRFEKRGMLYVDVKTQSGEDITITVPNIYGDNIPAWIDIVEIDNNFYIKGQEPKVEEKKTVKKSNKSGGDK